METENSTLIYDKQIGYEGNSYLDPKHVPVDSYSALTQVSLDTIFEGMEKTVISDETLHGDTSEYAYKNNEWNLIDATTELYNLNFVTFTALENNSSIGLAKLSTNQTLEYSRNTEEWSGFTTAVTVSLSSGQSVYVRGMLTNDNTSENFTQFKMSGKIKVSGNLNSVWNYVEPNTPLKKYCGWLLFNGCESLVNISTLTLPSMELNDYCYYRMFYKCNMTSVPKNLLPAMIMKPYCYAGLFYNCEKLIKGPDLPATTLAKDCYWGMFDECHSLKESPQLPATVLAEECYYGMFINCVSLTTAPELPVTTLAQSSYGYMFFNCTSLTTAPELPATTLASSCYSYMFYNCTSLKYIKCLAISGINQNNSTVGWVYGVANSGSFVKHPNATSWTRGSNGIPSNWTVQNASI